MLNAKKINIIAQVILWTFFISIVLVVASIFEGTDILPNPRPCLMWGILVNHILFGGIVVYGNYFLVFPLFLKKKYKRHVITVLTFLTVLAVLRIYTEEYFCMNIPQHFQYQRSTLFTAQLMGLMMLTTLYGIFENWLKTTERENQLRHDKLQAELKFLKSQINPHFLFNSLNNIYSLAYRQSKHAAPMVAKLSKIMRYMLYDCSAEKVPLLKEAQLLKDYIEIHQLQKGDALTVDFYSEGIKNQHQIAPMLLINFVENSFKHSDFATNPKAWISISMVVEEEKLHFQVENTARPKTEQKEEGVGNKNALRQLDLNYEGQYVLEMEQKFPLYKVSLEIKLE